MGVEFLIYPSRIISMQIIFLLYVFVPYCRKYCLKGNIISHYILFFYKPKMVKKNSFFKGRHQRSRQPVQPYRFTPPTSISNKK